MDIRICYINRSNKSQVIIVNIDKENFAEIEYRPDIISKLPSDYKRVIGWARVRKDENEW